MFHPSRRTVQTSCVGSCQEKSTMKAIMSLVACGILCWILWQQKNVQYQITTALQNPTTQQHKNDLLSTLQNSTIWQLLPLAPVLELSNIQHQALDDFFQYSKSSLGWIHVNALQLTDVDRLRQLGRTIMDRNTSCREKLQVIPRNMTLADGLEFCFWEGDYVSDCSLQNFSFESSLWGWVLQQYQTLERELQQVLLQENDTIQSSTPCHLAFLDIGVNVGDWASPLRMALPPMTPFFGIEGSPPTGAIATANIRTSIEHLYMSLGNMTNPKSSIGIVAPTALLPFSLLTKRMVRHVAVSGGVCFGADFANVGGQSVKSTGSDFNTSLLLECRPSLLAGGTLLPHALKALIPLQQQDSTSCPGRLDWPRVYIAKLDVEGFEFKALTSALDWLMERPPCYIIIEFHPVPQIGGIVELLLDVGYDSLWLSRNFYDPNAELAQFPSNGRPIWSSSSSVSLHSTVENFMRRPLRRRLGYFDFVFGFGNRTECLRQLMEQ